MHVSGSSSQAVRTSAVGVDNLMFETDFPHPTCLYPQPFNAIAATFDEHGVEWPVREKLLGGNAARVYNIDLS